MSISRRSFVASALPATAVPFLLSSTALAAPQDSGTGRMVTLTFDLPAVGNVDLIKAWRFGRLETVTAMGQNDVILDIRERSGNVFRAFCPTVPFHELARASLWTADSRQFPSRREIVERMVAFDTDENDRIIALVSLEPIPRNERRLARAFDSRRL